MGIYLNPNSKEGKQAICTIVCYSAIYIYIEREIEKTSNPLPVIKGNGLCYLFKRLYSVVMIRRKDSRVAVTLHKFKS